MIEGLRVLPHWQALIAETPNDQRRDCTTCMKHNDSTRRRYMGCGYEPRMPVMLNFWAPQPLLDDWHRQDPATRDVDVVMTCPGYTTQLPEVVEVAVWHPQYQKHYLAEALGETPTPETLYAHATLERSHAAWEADALRKRQEAADRGR